MHRTLLPLLLPVLAACHHAVPSASVPVADTADAPKAAPAKPSTAHADAQRLSSIGHSVKWNFVPEGKTDRYGHAEVLVRAPIAKVRDQILDFAHYKDFVPDKFHNARIVSRDRTLGSTDLYMQIPIMHGLVTLWDILRFSALQKDPSGVETLEGRLVRGNVKDAELVFALLPVNVEYTVLKCDLLILPTVPAPQEAIDEELRDAAMQAVDAIRDRAQGERGDFAYRELEGASLARADAAP